MKNQKKKMEIYKNQQSKSHLWKIKEKYHDSLSEKTIFILMVNLYHIFFPSFLLKISIVWKYKVAFFGGWIYIFNLLSIIKAKLTNPMTINTPLKVMYLYPVNFFFL